MGGILESTDARNKLEDLSGVKLDPDENPYKALIRACKDDAAEIQSLYATHRETRNAQQKEKLLSPGFKELVIDPFLLRLENPALQPGFKDPRNCLVLWARPPDHVLKLASHLQSVLRTVAPQIWLMPPHRMHMTSLEIVHSKTPEEIASLVAKMRPSIPQLASFTFQKRARLVKPMISFDLSAFALSFLPASGEKVLSLDPISPYNGSIAHPELGGTGTDTAETDAYTYHHLRRDLFDRSRSSGVDIASRYVVPSAHITLGRYLSQVDHETPQLRDRWVKAIEELNHWLRDEVWDRADSGFIGEWIVGQERGLDVRSGPLWYGGGKTILTGEGF